DFDVGSRPHCFVNAGQDLPEVRARKAPGRLVIVYRHFGEIIGRIDHDPDYRYGCETPPGERRRCFARISAFRAGVLPHSLTPLAGYGLESRPLVDLFMDGPADPAIPRRLVASRRDALASGAGRDRRNWNLRWRKRNVVREFLPRDQR